MNSVIKYSLELQEKRIGICYSRLLLWRFVTYTLLWKPFFSPLLLPTWYHDLGLMFIVCILYVHCMNTLKPLVTFVFEERIGNIFMFYVKNTEILALLVQLFHCIFNLQTIISSSFIFIHCMVYFVMPRRLYHILKYLAKNKRH